MGQVGGGMGMGMGMGSVNGTGMPDGSNNMGGGMGMGMGTLGGGNQAMQGQQRFNPAMSAVSPLPSSCPRAFVSGFVYWIIGLTFPPLPRSRH